MRKAGSFQRDRRISWWFNQRSNIHFFTAMISYKLSRVLGENWNHLKIPLFSSAQCGFALWSIPYATAAGSSERQRDAALQSCNPYNTAKQNGQLCSVSDSHIVTCRLKYRTDRQSWFLTSAELMSNCQNQKTEVQWREERIAKPCIGGCERKSTVTNQTSRPRWFLARESLKNQELWKLLENVHQNK